MNQNSALHRAKKRYAASAKGKACAKRHANTPKGILTRRKAHKKYNPKYEHSPRGKAKRAIANAKRRSIFKTITCDLSEDQWQTILKCHNYSCRYCGSKELKLTMDHVIPITKGGQHTKDNVVPACQPCNSRKGAKILIDIPLPL